MADQEIRKGVRLLLAGGMPGLDSETLQRLKHTCEIEQRQRNPAALTAKDAEYLSNYIEICDGFLNETYDHDDATERLKMLNDYYTDDELAENVRKTEIPGSDLANRWMSSAGSCW